MVELKIKREEFLSTHILGTMKVILDGVILGAFHTLERPWLENKPCVSCIPLGDYNIEQWNSENHPKTFHVMDVENRSYILIHSGNLVKHSKGCILLGMSRADIDGDGNQDIGRSKEAMRHLNSLIRGVNDKVKLTIE
jgi:hypothetical protein